MKNEKGKMNNEKKTKTKTKQKQKQKKQSKKNEIAIKAKKLFLSIQCLTASQKGALEFHLMGLTRAS